MFLKEAAEVAGSRKPRPYPICSTGKSSCCSRVQASWIRRSWMMRARTARFFALAVRMQPVGGDAERGGISRYRPTVAIMQFDQLQEISDQPRSVATQRIFAAGFVRHRRTPQMQAKLQHMG